MNQFPSEDCVSEKTQIIDNMVHVGMSTTFAMSTVFGTAELTTQIVANLPPRQVLIMRHVNKTFRNIVDDTSTWQEVSAVWLVLPTSSISCSNLLCRNAFNAVRTLALSNRRTANHGALPDFRVDTSPRIPAGRSETPEFHITIESKQDARSLIGSTGSWKHLPLLRGHVTRIDCIIEYRQMRSTPSAKVTQSQGRRPSEDEVKARYTVWRTTEDSIVADTGYINMGTLVKHCSSLIMASGQAWDGTNVRDWMAIENSHEVHDNEDDLDDNDDTPYDADTDGEGEDSGEEASSLMPILCAREG